MVAPLPVAPASRLPSSPATQPAASAVGARGRDRARRRGHIAHGSRTTSPGSTKPVFLSAGIGDRSRPEAATQTYYGRTSATTRLLRPAPTRNGDESVPDQAPAQVSRSTTSRTTRRACRSSSQPRRKNVGRVRARPDGPRSTGRTKATGACPSWSSLFCVLHDGAVSDRSAWSRWCGGEITDPPGARARSVIATFAGGNHVRHHRATRAGRGRARARRGDRDRTPRGGGPAPRAARSR